MKKALVILGVLVALCAAAMAGFLFYTKSFSPEKRLTLKEEGVELTVKYCRPYKRERKIFGALVPFGKMWRTGANEATIFDTKQKLRIGGEDLPAGTYSLWTIPEEDYWTIVFNGEYGQWGIRASDGEANHDPDMDVLRVKAPARTSTIPIEQFTITLQKSESIVTLALAWDDTQVALPMELVQ